MPTPGRTSVGRYELRKRLGIGGMGTVWHAWDPALQRDVAVKEVLLPEGMTPEDRAEAHARTLREAQATARISHTSVVTIHDVLDHDKSPWIVMELLSGSSLQHRLDTGGPMPVERVEQAARALLGGLKAAHAAGVTHRDVKPANIMLTEDDRTVLTDFGIANVDGSAALTQTGVYIGSPEYMAPERFEGERALPASDLWSLGVTLYSLLEGRSPFKRDSITGMISAVLTAPVPPKLVENEDAETPKSLALRALIGALLTRDVAARPSPQEALELLERERQAAQRHVGTEKSALPDLGAVEAAAVVGDVATGGARGTGAPGNRPGAGRPGGASRPGGPGGPGPARPGGNTPAPDAPAPHNTPSPHGGTPAWGQQPPSRVRSAQSGTARPQPAPAPRRNPVGPRQPPSGPQAGGYSWAAPPAMAAGRGAGAVGPGGAVRPTGPAGATAQGRPGAGPDTPPGPGGAAGTDAGARFLEGTGHTGTNPGAPVPAGSGRGAEPDAAKPTAVLTAMVMLGLNALVLFVLTALSIGQADDPATDTTWGSVVVLGLWGVLSAFAAFGLLTRSRLVFALVVIVQGIAAVSLAMSMFTVFVYTPELMVVYTLMLLYTLGIGGLLLVPGASRAYFGLG
ncbi:serine/threonine-protein kinase [Nocardiopsis ganjiahuensis]|uniref:serine/threonine-protein kinase n=1 Tax=Nocardiopsis ganjiahuensis TaxID=239984 RepID=UPI0006866547|nr:serine/threonine-protein kinase [Nocardiopsis ganjiahuensis]